MRCGRAFGLSVLFSLFFLTARPLDSQNGGNWFLKIQCRFQLSSGQDEGILAVEIRDLKLSVTPHTAGEKTSFEFTEYIVILGNNKVKVATIYRKLYNELSYARILIGSHL